ETVTAESVPDERDERLTVRLRVQRFPAVGDKSAGTTAVLRHLIEVRRDIEEALGAQEIAVADATGAADQAQTAMQRRLGRVGRGESSEFAAAFGVQLRGDGDRLDKRGLAAPVVADEEGDGRIERELV